MSDASIPTKSPTVATAGALGDGDEHPVFIEFIFRTMNNAFNFSVSETVTGSVSGITGTVVSWNSATKTLLVNNPSPNAGNYLWNKNENITGGSTGAQGVIQFINYPTYVRNEPD